MVDNTMRLVPIEDGDSADRVQLGYYVCVVATRFVAVGQYVRVTRVERDGAGATVHMQRRDRGYTQPGADFLDHFAFAPDGEQRFQVEMLALMGEIAALSHETSNLHAALQGVTVYADAGQAAGLDAVTALVPLEDRSLAGLKVALARVRQIAQEKQALLTEKQTALQAMLAEQMAVAQAMIRPLEQMVQKIQEGIWTINLYLGRDEEIVRLMDGAPAPADTPITIRQLVLAMDEECAIAADDGGIDSRAIEAFDAWLVERPEHLAQVLPEPKGVVVLVPRWESKRYDDPWVQKAIAEGDRQSYFLIRNGERVYRIWTNLIVGTTLVPTRDEFLSFFYEERRDDQAGTVTRVPLTPGSRQYMEAEKKADARNRHYMRIGLILQGLIDRTTVFHPLPGPIAMTRLDSFERGWVRIITDAELALSDGRERFRDWQRRTNAALEPGMRIIGSFGGWSNDGASFSFHREDGRNRRLTPDTAEPPKSDTLYTTEGKRGSGWYFLYDRGEVWSRDEGYRPARVRASCEIHPTDRFFISFDAITVEEIDSFLRSRLDRRDYVSMFPVLKAARAMKLREAAEEEPFRQLLVSQIVARYGVAYEDAAAEVSDLIAWWKYKARTHRALTGTDDAKALRMIVDEFAIRLRERQNRAERERQGEFDCMLAWALDRHPDALLVAHKSGSEYVMLVPQNDEPVYVAEITFTARGVAEERAWRTVDNRWQRWHILHTSDRWPGWKRFANVFEHLTDPERTALGAQATAAARRYHEEARRRYAWTDREPVFSPLAVTFDPKDNLFRVYAFAAPASVPTDLLTGEIRDVQVSAYRITWRREPERTVVLTGVAREQVAWPEQGSPWDAGQYRSDGPFSGTRSRRQQAEAVLVVDEAQIAAVLAEHERYIAARSARERLQSLRWNALRGLEAQWLAREEQRQYEAFLREYGDPTLWEGHAKTLPTLAYPYDRRNRDAIEAMLGRLIERGHAIDGMAVAQAARLAAELGASPLPERVLADLEALILRTTNEEAVSAG